MRWYAILALLWTGKSRTVTSFPRSIISYCSACMKFGKLILRKIINIVATRCLILKLNARNSISAGALLQTMLGKLTVLPQTL